MTRDDIIRMAREAGASTPRSIWPPTFQMSIDFSGAQLERFANLVAAHKAEVALAEAYRYGYEAGVKAAAVAAEKHARWIGYNAHAEAISAAIRARTTP